MTSNDANGIAPANRRSLRRDDAAGKPPEPAEVTAQPGLSHGEPSLAWARIERVWWVGLGGAMLVFSAFPIANHFLGLSTKDYGLWYQVGLAVRQGLDIYPRPETGRLFPFMYPPSAAAMLAWVSMLGSFGSLLALLLVNSAAWVACILLSVWLAAGTRVGRHPLVVIVPSLCIVVLVYNVYLLGQPNLALLALLLGSFACLRLGRPVGAGALLATAAAIKAFPILALGYLIYRRMWTASVVTVAVLAAWLLLAPLPFRTPAQAVDDLVVWSQGMLFKYNTHGIAQRPFRSYSYKNQSIMALAHRLLRDLPADGETVLSRRAQAWRPAAFQGTATHRPIDRFAYVPETPFGGGQRKTGLHDRGAPASSSPDRPGNTEQAPRWEDFFQAPDPRLAPRGGSTSPI